MALQTIQGGILFPTRPPHLAAAIAFGNNLVIDANDEKAAFIFMAPKTGTVSKIWFRTATVTTGDTVDVRLETVDATTGAPSGTLFAANTNGSQSILLTDDNTVFVTTLTATASVTKGDLLTIVVALPSVAVGNMVIAAISGAAMALEYPYSALYTGTWAKGTNICCCALEYNDGSYAHVEGVFPFSAVANTAFNSGSTPDERGNMFQVPFPCRVTGFWLWADLDGNCDIVLYDSDGTTALLTKSLDLDNRPVTTNARQVYPFNSTANLSANTNYRIVLKPTSATSVTLQEFTVNAAAVMDAHSGGQNVHLTTRVDAGSWTQTTTQRAMIGVALDGFDDAVSAAGGGGRRSSVSLGGITVT